MTSIPENSPNYSSTELLARIGNALYGSRWQTDMAHDLEVNTRTIRRWTTGEWPIPNDRWRQIWRLMIGKSERIERMARELNGVTIIPPMIACNQ